ncbi:MAG: sugar phosphate isomerase/epimerase family protein [Gemmatimonadales bacterium]|nr:sugar phosphate isomerase/epimerase family protein [Gemmatimonadales bacterium]
MKFGINTFIWSLEFGPEQVALLPSIREAGFHGIEVACFDPERFASQLIREATAGEGLQSTTVTVVPRGMSLLDDDAGIRATTIDYFRRLIDAVAASGSRTFAGPFYSPVGYLPGRRRTEAEWNHAIESYRVLAPHAAAQGVVLAIEPLNRFETYFLNTAADARRLAEEVNHPGLGILFDTFHANIEEKDIAAGYRTVSPWLRHVHTCENDRGTPGSGHVEWAAVFNALRDVGYDGWLTIESFGFALPELSAAAAIWRDIEPTPDRIAFDGIRFLQQHFPG